MDKTDQVLNDVFGYTAFRGQQKEIVEAVVAGKDALVLMPTGGGKSLCYQIPALVMPGCGVVISPLIALMHDQVTALKQLGVKAACLNSSQSHDENNEVQEQLLAGEIDLLYLSPERLLNDYVLNMLKKASVVLFAIDEAHCVSQWGHDFRKEYQKLSVLVEHFPDVPRLALTATADDRVRQEILENLRLEKATTYLSSFDRPNIQYAIEEQVAGKSQLHDFIKNNHPNDAGIVYCLSRRKVETITEYLASKGFTALPYHAGLTTAERQQNQSRFILEEGVIIVATIAFGMGIDKPDVRFVAHFSMPKNIEAYYQETGRAGRDGLPANAWMAYNYQDVVLQRQFIQNSDAATSHQRVLHTKLDSLIDLCEQVHCRRQSLLAYFGESLAEPCGHCDNCIQPPKTIDATEQARIALSSIYRTGQRFGMMYLIDVILGKSNERIENMGHHNLKVFAMGQDHAKNWWRSLFRQLISRSYVLISDSDFGALKLSEKCRDLLKGESTFRMRDLVVKSSKKKKPVAEASDFNSYDLALWEALRGLRTSLASEQGVPPYVVFSDASLQDMVKKRPDTLEKFMYVSGVGAYKKDTYGMQFLQIIDLHPLPESLDNRLSGTVNITLDLLLKGNLPEKIAELRTLSINTVYSHLAEAIAAGVVDVKKVVQLSDQEREVILQVAEVTGYSSEKKIKPVYDALDQSYEYHILRCVLAEMA